MNRRKRVSGRERCNIEKGKFGKSTRRASTAALGTRASANTSGPDFTWAEKSPVKLRKGSAPNEENCFLLPDRFSNSSKVDPAV
jgi:hypothetical protein